MHPPEIRKQERLRYKWQEKLKLCGVGLVPRIWLLDRDIEVQEKKMDFL